MVGPRGERRLIKGLNREGMVGTGGGVSLLSSRGRGAGGWKPRGGMSLRTRGATSNNDTENDDTDNEGTDPEATIFTTNR